jgi:hypothetical protein
MGLGGQCHALAALLPETSQVPPVQEAWSAPGLVWMRVEKRKSPASIEVRNTNRHAVVL